MNLNHTITQLGHALDVVPHEDVQDLRELLAHAQLTLDQGGFSEADELLHVIALRVNHLIELS